MPARIRRWRCEEIFGPVLPILRVRDFDEAIDVANGTRYGLAASLFTSRVSHIDEFTPARARPA